MIKKKKRKIIHYSSPRTIGSYFPPGDSPNYFLAGWSSQVARRALKYTDKYIMENWRFEQEIKGYREKRVENITCKLFPAKKLPLIRLFSRDLLNALKKEAKENEILLHLHTSHNIMAYLLAYIFRHIPVVISNYGTSPPHFSYLERKKFKFVLNHIIEKRVLKYYDFFFPTGADEREYLAKYVDAGKIANSIGLGADFEKIKPVNKLEVRKKLGIPPPKKK